MTGGQEGERAQLVAVLVLTAVLAVWMDLSPIHGFHDSDSLVPVLMSLQRWTPFYWEQNRFGQLVPLLAVPVRGPYDNLLVQVALRLAAVVLSFFLLARTVVPRPYWPAVGAATLALYVGGKGLFDHCFIQMQPYAQALALGLAGASLLDAPLRGRRGAVRVLFAAILIGLAFWISLSLIVWLAVFLWLRRVLGLEPGAVGWRLWPRLRPLPGKSIEWSRFLPFALTITAFCCSVLVSRYAGGGGTDLGPAKPGTWFSAWSTLAPRFVSFLGTPLAVGTAVVLTGTSIAALARRSPQARLAVSAGLCLLGTAAIELLVLGTSSWVRLNSLPIRYLSCGLLAAGTALPAMGAILLLEGRRESWHRAANAAAVLGLLVLVLVRFGPPSPSAARAAFDGHIGPSAKAIVAARCTHVIGSYWQVWPAVLRANEILWEQGATRQVWGITARSRPTRDLWQPRSWTLARVAVIRDVPAAAAAMAAYRLPPLYLSLEARGLRVYAGSACARKAVASRCPPVLCSAQSDGSCRDPFH
jgi:hypothetical protein